MKNFSATEQISWCAPEISARLRKGLSVNSFYRKLQNNQIRSDYWKVLIWPVAYGGRSWTSRTKQANNITVCWLTTKLIKLI